MVNDENFWARVGTLIGTGAFRQAISLLDEASPEGTARELRPVEFFLYHGLASYFLSNFEAAVADYEHAIEVDNQNVAAHACLGYIFATCPEDAFCDGERALHHATKACELSNWLQEKPLAILAAAYARLKKRCVAEQHALRAFELASDQYTKERVLRLISTIRNDRPHTADPKEDFEKLLLELKSKKE